MVSQINSPSTNKQEAQQEANSTFPATAPAANPVFFRTYSRRDAAGTRESWEQVGDRTLKGLINLGKLSLVEIDLIKKMQAGLKTLTSGRWLWVGGTNWVEQPQNFSGAYNCTSTNIEDWRSFGLLMDLAMMGSGTGAVLEPKYINQLPPIRNQLQVEIVGAIGTTPKPERREETEVIFQGNQVTIHVGDSRQGWVKSYQSLLELSTDPRFTDTVQVRVDINDVRPTGESLQGFGGVANPVKLPELYNNCANILNKALGRQLNSVECCLLIDHAAVVVVAGNVRRSAGMRQFSSEDELGATAKDNLWSQDEQGNWRIDPEKDALRMSNHTRVFHTKPTEEECINAVRKQFYSGEGAIQWAGEAIARANVDLVKTPELKQEFIAAYTQGKVENWIRSHQPEIDKEELQQRLQRYGLNPCGEILSANFHCVSGDTLLITKDGMHKIQDIIDAEVEIWNGKNWSQVQPFKTGSSCVLYRVCFGDGSYLDATEYHRFFVKDRFGKSYKEVQTKDLMDVSHYGIHTEPFTIEYEDGLNVELNYAYTLGVAVGDGTTDQKDNAKVRLYGKKAALNLSGNKSPIRDYDYLPTFTDVTDLGFSGEFLKSLKTNPEALNAIAAWNRQAILHFVAGLADTDGSNTSSNGIRIYISDYDRAYRVQLLLTKCGIRSSLNLCAHQGAVTNYGIRSRDLYYLQITDCSEIPCQRLDVSKGTNAKYKGKWQVVKSVEQLPGLHDTYCFNESVYHKGVFGNTLAGNCNLSEIHLNQIDPQNFEEQEEAFRAGALSVAVLLHHQFQEPRYQASRQLDPIVGVSFTGLFDFFVHAFGSEWLQWWEAGRPDTVKGLEFKQQEQEYLSRWREIVHQQVWDYCDRHGLKRPNRCTTVQPAGCLDRTALRIFDQGLLYADEVVTAGSGESKGLDLSVRNGIATDTAIANQPLNLVRVTLENGRVLRMTPNHRLAIANQWVRADQLKLGMEIDYSLGEYHKQEDALLLNLNPLQYTREGRKELLSHSRGILTAEITTPTTLNPELGYFLGCLFGDGSMSENKNRVRFSFNVKEEDLVHRLQVIARQWFGITGIINYDSRNGVTRGELTFASKQLFDWLNLNHLQKGSSADIDRIPLAIRQSSRNTILSFFCGLIDTDGCVRERGSLSIDSSSENFLRNLQQIGEAVGLCFSIFHNTQGENFQGQKNMWGLCLSRMLTQPYALAYLNTHSRKCKLRPLPQPKRQFAFHPYRVASIEFENTPDYSYDFAVSGTDDNDSWYWQGAIKSHNTKSLLTGSSPGWHPPKAQRFIRRITFRKNDAVALACMDYGYTVIPSQTDKDEKGNLLNDPFDPRCTEWLVEIPVAVSWADLPGADSIEISKFSALAQMDFYMQVQKFYTRHNTSATIELREPEIEALGKRIYEAIRDDEGYISAALLARFDDHQTFPRLPFEPIDKQTYDELMQGVVDRRRTEDFYTALMTHDLGTLPNIMEEVGPAGCDSDKCLLPEKQPS